MTYDDFLYRLKPMWFELSRHRADIALIDPAVYAGNVAPYERASTLALAAAWLARYQSETA